MKITKVASYRDGGTISIRGILDGIDFEVCIDHRISSKAPSRWNGYEEGSVPNIWNGYPEAEGSTLLHVDSFESLRQALLEFVVPEGRFSVYMESARNRAIAHLE